MGGKTPPIFLWPTNHVTLADNNFHSCLSLTPHQSLGDKKRVYFIFIFHDTLLLPHSPKLAAVYIHRSPTETASLPHVITLIRNSSSTSSPPSSSPKPQSHQPSPLIYPSIVNKRPLQTNQHLLPFLLSPNQYYNGGIITFNCMVGQVGSRGTNNS